MARIATAPIMVPETEVARALRRLKRLVPSSTRGAWRDVRIAVDVDRDLFIEAYNGENRGRIYLTAKVSTIGFDATVSLAALDNAIEGMGYMRLVRSRAGKASGADVLRVVGDRPERRLELAAWRAGDPPTDMWFPFVHSDATALRDVVNRVHWFASEQSEHPSLDVIALGFGDETLYAYATDSYRMARMALAGAQTGEATTQVLSSRDLMVAVAGAREGGIILELHPRRLVRLRRSGEEWWLRSRDVVPPPYEQLLAQYAKAKPVWDAKVDAAALCDAFETVGEELPRVKGEAAAVLLRCLKTEVVVSTRLTAAGGGSESRVALGASAGAHADIRLTAWMAKEVFGAFDGEVRLRVYATRRHPLLIGGGKRLALLMPVLGK